MTGNIRTLKPDAPPVALGFVPTDTARAILRALRRARAKAKLTLIAGAPGIGKTETLHRFRAEAPDMLVHSAVSGEGGVFNLACALCELVGLRRPETSDLATSRHQLAEAIGAGGFLIVDEAQYLVQRKSSGKDDTAALEWARALSEDGGFGLALVGDMSLALAVVGLPQLDRRTHPRVVVGASDRADVAAVCAAHGLTDPKTVDRLTDKARRFGGLGYVSEILNDARDMSGTGAPTLEDYEAAMQLFEEGCR